MIYSEKTASWDLRPSAGSGEDRTDIFGKYGSGTPGRSL